MVLPKYYASVISAGAGIHEEKKGAANMIKIYGMPTCPYCDYVHEQIKGREEEFEYINIGETIDPADAGLIEYGTPGACSIEDHRSGRKGC